MAGRQLERAHHNVQATLIPAGCAAIVRFKMSVLGTFIIVDHSIERAFNHGALAQLKVTGPRPARLFGQAVRSRLPARGDRNRVARQGARAPAARTKAERIQIGAGIFADNCQACHQSNVTGRLEAKFTVNGHDFSGVMPSWSLSDEESPRCDFRLHRHFTIDAIV
jgi:nitrite reductase (NO-forming)